MPQLHAWLAFAVFLVSTCSGKIYNDISGIHAERYDFIIAGGGTGGLVIANRLSENPNVSVLVVEAGVSNEGVKEIQVPFFCTRASPQTLYDWNYTTVPQQALNSRALSYNRGHVLGGSSSTNFMIYTRGSSEDYDRIANITGDPGWSWDNLQPYILRNERLTPPADGHNTTGQVDPSIHGHNGINPDSLPGYPTPMDDRIIKATQELSAEFPYNVDYNSGAHLGIGWGIAAIFNGTRSSSATSYLGPQYAARRNLDVILNTRVTRVFMKRKAPNSPLRIDAVEVAATTQGLRKRIGVNKEAILSAGSIGSPQILMNSGIGNAAALEKLGIPSVVHNPSVGQNLSDHPIVGNIWVVNETRTWEEMTRNATKEAEYYELWRTKRQGPLVNTVTTQLGWHRVPDGSGIFGMNGSKDPAAGPNTAHFELVFANGFRGTPPPTGNYMTIATVVVAPSARGSVELTSSDPFSPPTINPNLLGTESDMSIMKYAIQAARRFASASAWNGYILEAYSGTNPTTDEEIDVFIRNNTRSIYHPVGTASMSAKDAGYGVVDPDLNVKGVDGLRVVDASVFPYIPSAHTHVPVYILAERGAQIIKDTWNL
ncbi:hypothetical protein E1B28_000255 [Marasmius oreades]|uniref:Glucose-methanol-choline oxidoreductase N-terminal domain-containing protein n=1 Tax=Marasmius oreades TaxID=181124 RepID=A0A9P8AE60_9AGAR|nr:uncharacterized protein E1B28_000255 [Marasmius oreades]KAG7098292.1 hypothetical protein E1B28_000255 [Marasmius oreades]